MKVLSDMRTRAGSSHFAGFWVRLAAIWIDAALTYLVVALVVTLFAHFNTYVPFEASFFGIAITYSLVFTAWKGQTIGKALCGITVRSKHDEPIGFRHAIVRECAGKLVSGAVLLVGFVWVAFSAKKRGWHDHLAGTVVILRKGAARRARLITAVVLIPNAAWGGVCGFKAIALYRDLAEVAVDRNIATRYSDRDPSLLVEVGSLDRSDHPAFAQWLDGNGTDPLDFAVQTAANHDITIFGEFHWVQENLSFLNRLVSQLYHRAGVTVLAMEACRAEDNTDLTRLVSADQFDPGLALQIARHVGWADWGWKGYWDLLETVWRLNRSLPQDKEKMRIIGIDAKWDGPSLGLVGLGDDDVDGPILEKLRLFRLLGGDLLRLAKRDEIMARNVEREIIEKGKRGVVWIGANHSFIHYRQASVSNGKVSNEWPRMGFMLHHKYGDRVFQIHLHGASWGCSTIAALIEEVSAQRHDAPVGFRVDGSPFGLLRDDAALAFRFRPGVCFADLAAGYIYLKPNNNLNRCRWLDDYVSQEMFIKNKPYYEARCRRRLRNAEEANTCLSER